MARFQGTERTKEHFNIFLEYVPGGSIASLLAKFGERLVVLPVQCLQWSRRPPVVSLTTSGVPC